MPPGTSSRHALECGCREVAEREPETEWYTWMGMARRWARMELETPMAETQTTEATRVDVLSSIEKRVDELPEWRTFTANDACELLDAIDGIKRRAKLAEDALEAFLIGWMPEKKVGELRIGSKKWWVGKKKKTPKCRSVPRTLEAIMVATGGDYEAACNTLSSNAIKYGEARKILGKAYPDHFEEVTETRLLSEGENPLVLNKSDERFIK